MGPAAISFSNARNSALRLFQLRHTLFIFMKLLDYILNRITMYRLVLYVLLLLLSIAVVYSFFGLLPYDPISIVESALFLTIIGYITNYVFSRVFETPVNIESVYITALILALIITPPQTFQAFIFLGWAAVWAMASKFIFSLHRKHIFNPAAIAVVVTAFGLGLSATWWVGTAAMLPFVVVGGLLIVRKIQREDMVFTFFITVIVSSIGLGLMRNSNPIDILTQLFFHSSMLFFAFIMLTEPLTMPSRKNQQLWFAVLVGVLFLPQIHLGSIYSTPELALVIGNLFAYIVSPKAKLFLKVKEIITVAPGVIDFVFETKHKLHYLPGQYMEWTLGHGNVDSRGVRRYFTLASSPTEDTVRLGVKFYKTKSSYKSAMVDLNKDTVIVAHQLAGDFVMPEDKTKKLAFIAGGIGVTPFRSMVKYVSDKKEKRDIVLLYSNKTAEEIAYKEIFDEAEKTIGLRTVYTVTDREQTPSHWNGMVGRVGTQMVKDAIPDYMERTFYLSGTNSMVDGLEKVLKELGVASKYIKKDFFPGLA